MEDAIRDISRDSLSKELAPLANLAALICMRFSPLGGVELPEVPREPMRKPPTFDECSSSTPMS